MFRWHAATRVFDGTGQEFGPAWGASGVIDDRPAGAALAQAFAGPFRIGGEGPAPETGFETLTSGSTAAPRRIRRQAASWTRSFAVNAGLFGIGPGLRVAVLGRLSQSLALYGAMEAVQLGAELHLLDGMRPDRQAAALASVRVQLIYATPAQMRGLVEAGVDWPDLARVVIGGSKLDAGLRAELVARAPGAMLNEFYGAAETSFITLAGPDSPADSVGRLYPGVNLVVDALAGEVGQIWVKSPYLFDGYAGEGPTRWRDGYVSVGEMGRLEGDHLYLAGRAGRMVTVADQNVFPEEVETFLHGLPGVRRAAVLPVQDARRGQHLVAVLQGDSGVEAAVMAALRQRLGVLRAPKRVIWVQDWPELPSGKTDLQQLSQGVGG
ncbi:MAG: AMP-binding protein [Pseudorhodobacter sp.]|nr:AMP-binding protein [Pseudorhodobacter sp.]